MFEKPNLESNKNKQELFKAVFHSKNWEEFQKLPEKIRDIKQYESAEAPPIFRLRCGLFWLSRLILCSVQSSRKSVNKILNSLMVNPVKD